ncbi:hypothetical protein [Clostridium sp.]|uniref:hypothetical protein n=1 Tax=Clostridium sp. TaxID=1506 RepID=UPI003F2C0307
MGFWSLFKNKSKNEENQYEDEDFIREEFIKEVNEEITKTVIEEEKVESIEFEIPLSMLEEKEIELEEVVEDKEFIEALITSEILKVVENSDNYLELKESAEKAAKKIGVRYINLLPEYLNGKVTRTKNLRVKYETLPEWHMAVENAVLMILFSYKESGVKILSKIANGNSNLRLKSINLLCKLAAEGVCVDSIVNDVMNSLIHFDDDKKIIIFGFMSQIKGNKQVIGLIQHFYKMFVKHGEIVRGYETLIHLMNAAETFTKGHLNFLKMIAIGKTNINLEEIMGIDEGDKKIIYINDLDEIYHVKAAITYFSLDNTDDDINSKLYYWSEYSLDKKIRQDIKKIIGNI